ncbi:M16 family metallopeptidase [Sphingopyxis sp. LARHCG72]
MRRLFGGLLTAASALIVPSALAAPSTSPAASDRINVDLQYYSLPNGLKVVLSRQPSVPVVTVATYYGIGFRVEPRDKTGFAHLFEHLMFQGSTHAPKGTLMDTVTASGGVLNGSTRFDFTNYYEIIPSSALARMLWLDSDRMARPVINDAVLKNQQDVVVNEVKVNVINQPYGGWPWLDLPMLANSNWHNSHNFYGELKEIESATTKDALDFQKKFYVPNNAVLVVVGDIDYGKTKGLIEAYYGSIPRGPEAELPDLSESPQTEEKSRSRVDPLAPKPGWSAGYHMPERNTPEWYAMGLIDQLLVQGQDSLLYRELVQESGVASQFSGGINALGNMFNYRGPMLFAFSFTHDAGTDDAQIRRIVDGVIDGLREKPVSAIDLARARTKLRSSLYDNIDTTGYIGLVDLLASYALFDDDPGKVNRLMEGFDRVTPELLQKTAREYLRPTNRSIATIEAGRIPEAAKKEAE